MAQTNESKKNKDHSWDKSYIKEHYDHFNLVFPKGGREKLNAIAKRHGKSANAFMLGLIDKALESTGEG